MEIFEGKKWKFLNGKMEILMEEIEIFEKK